MRQGFSLAKKGNICARRNGLLKTTLSPARLDAAMQHFELALTLNPRHRSAHAHLGEAQLMRGDRAKAEARLSALERICLIPCEEYEDLKRAIAGDAKVAKH
jgi:hypothetical protein